MRRRIAVVVIGLAAQAALLAGPLAPLATARPDTGAVVPAAPEGTAQAAFVARLRAALDPLDAQALADLSALPWTFEGRPADRALFVQRVVPALFTPGVRRCLQRVAPAREGEALVFACRPYGFVATRRGPGAPWQLVEFFVDVE